MTDDTDPLGADVTGRLAEALEEQRPEADAAMRLRARILSEAGAAAAQPAAEATASYRRRTVRGAERRWEKRPLGLEICVLHEDEHSRSVLVRMQPGSFIPPHSHDMDEENLLLEGDALIGDDVYMQAGDYHFVRAGEQHPVISSPNGCVVFVRGDRRMPLRVTPGFIGSLIRRYIPGLAQSAPPSKRD